MHKFIQGILGFSLRNRYFVFFCTGLVIIAGLYSYKHTAIDAFPDVTNTQVTIIMPDDNHGQILRLPTGNETAREGGAGIYFHFEYFGRQR